MAGAMPVSVYRIGNALLFVSPPIAEYPATAIASASCATVTLPSCSTSATPIPTSARTTPSTPANDVNTA